MIRHRTTTQPLLGRATIGDRFNHNGTEFTVANIERYETNTGRKRAAVTLEARCVVCGDWYQVTTCRAPSWIPRTCKRHRGQGPIK